MNARTFVSNMNGLVSGMEITELERASGRIVRVMFESEQSMPLDDVVFYLDEKSYVHVKFYNYLGALVDMKLGYHKLR